MQILRMVAVACVVMCECCVVFCFLYTNSNQYQNILNRFQFTFGDCLVLYDEPCNSRFMNFILLKNNREIRLDPVRTVMPASFNSSVPTKILIHGYGGYVIDAVIKNITQAYEQVGYNIIIVDWTDLSRTPCYPTAFINTWHVGQCTAMFSVNLIPLGITPEMLHLIGFSLGAHIASFASNILQKTMNASFGRITGLDPALPFFATYNFNAKLDPSDANFVDVIHTSSGSLGKLEAIGHIDFYMNGGLSQPACRNHSYPLVCSHGMAGRYFAESIIGTVKFMGVRCASFLNYILGYCRSPDLEKLAMGEYVDHRKSGTYFVDTADRPPFALGDR